MKLIVLSPEAEDAREPEVLAELIAAGLEWYHVRKPSWSRDRLEGWLRAVPAGFHARLVLHSHHDLAAEFAIGGVHERDSSGRAGVQIAPLTGAGVVNPAGAPSRRTQPKILRSRAVHDLTTLRVALNRYDRVLFSPVFPSLSKPGYLPDPAITPAELNAVLADARRAEVIALGGITLSRLPQCRTLGFDGVAVLGAVWQASDPVQAFIDLQRAAVGPVRSRSHSHAA